MEREKCALLYCTIIEDFSNFLTNQRVTVSLQFRRQKFTQDSEGAKLKSGEHNSSGRLKDCGGKMGWQVGCIGYIYTLRW
jgi:hypothetical protein